VGPPLVIALTKMMHPPSAFFGMLLSHVEHFRLTLSDVSCCQKNIFHIHNSSWLIWPQNICYILLDTEIVNITNCERKKWKYSNRYTYRTVVQFTKSDQIWPKLTESDPALTESNNVQVQQSAQYKCKVIMITSHGNTKRRQEPSGRPREPSGR